MEQICFSLLFTCASKIFWEVMPILADSNMFFIIIFFLFKAKFNLSPHLYLYVIGTGMFSVERYFVYTNLFLNKDITNGFEPVYFKSYKSQNDGISDFLPSLTPSRAKLYTIV